MLTEMTVSLLLKASVITILTLGYVNKKIMLTIASVSHLK